MEPCPFCGYVPVEGETWDAIHRHQWDCWARYWSGVLVRQPGARQDSTGEVLVEREARRRAATKDYLKEHARGVAVISNNVSPEALEIAREIFRGSDVDWVGWVAALAGMSASQRVYDTAHIIDRVMEKIEPEEEV